MRKHSCHYHILSTTNIILILLPSFIIIVLWFGEILQQYIPTTQNANKSTQFVSQANNNVLLLGELKDKLQGTSRQEINWFCHHLVDILITFSHRARCQKALDHIYWTICGAGQKKHCPLQIRQLSKIGNEFWRGCTNYERQSSNAK